MCRATLAASAPGCTTAVRASREGSGATPAPTSSATAVEDVVRSPLPASGSSDCHPSGVTMIWSWTRTPTSVQASAA